MRVEYLRVEPPGVPTAFWRSVGPSHNVFVTESFIDELAAAAKQDPVAYRRALLEKSPRAKAVLDLAAEKAGWGEPLPERVGRGVSLQTTFGTYMAQVAEVEVGKDGGVRVRRVVCALDAGSVVNPDTVEAQVQGRRHLRRHRRALWRDHHRQGPGRASQLRHLPDASHQRGAGDRGPYRPELRAAGRHGRTRHLGHRPGGRQRDLRRDGKTAEEDAGRRQRA